MDRVKDELTDVLEYVEIREEQKEIEEAFDRWIGSPSALDYPDMIVRKSDEYS